MKRAGLRGFSCFVPVLALFAACSHSSDPAAGPGPYADAGPSLDASSDGGSGSDAGTDGGTNVDGGDALVSSFVFVGCNRLQNADWDATKNPSSANVAQLKRTFADIVALGDRPRFFFFTGDLVLGMKEGAGDLTGQLAAWASLYKADPVAAVTELVPLVGNHEVLYKDRNGNEISNGPADSAWSDWAAKQGFAARAGNGPTSAPPNADALQDDQSKLSYSFDEGGTHFVVLNTDTWTSTPDSASVTGATQIGWVALRWLTADLTAAQANGKVERIFVFGHKPIAAPSGSTKSDEAVNRTLASGVASLLDATPKVKGYFCAHAHEWDARKLSGRRGVYQVVAGNGGSEVESGWKAPYYGFTEARVYASGRVGVVNHRRPVPRPYTGQAEPTQPSAELVISP